jgi:CBS domain-containing protein
MNVEDLMSRPAYTCSPTDSLNTAAQLMWERDCGAIPVVDEMGELVGIVTDRDICMAAYTQGKQLHAIPVAVAMTRQVYWCKPGDSIETAERLMRENRVRRVPVVDGSKRPVGLLSLDDLARDACSRREAAVERGFIQTAAAICEPRYLE